MCFWCLVCCGDRVADSCGLGQAPSEKVGNLVHSHVDTRNVMRTAPVSTMTAILTRGGERERERERERQESKSDTMHHFSAVDQKGGYDREALVQSRGWDLTGIS